MAAAVGRAAAEIQTPADAIPKPTSGELLVEEPLDVLYCVKSMAPSHVDKDITSSYQMENMEIAAGGFGKVFRAFDRKHPERRVAIKCMVLSSKRHKEVSDNEVKLMKSLDHPHICRLFETYQRGTLMYYVMELCEGKDIFDYMCSADLPRLGEPTASCIIQQVASALEYAHAKGIAHRDIKPENIVFASEDPNCNEIKVIDWGVGHDFGSSRMRHFAGTLRYCAPEVIKAECCWFSCYTAACDMWSLGVVIFVMLAGRMPFPGCQQELLQNMKREHFSMAGRIWNSVSDDAKNLIRRLLKADPKMRLSPKEVLNHPWIAGRDRHLEMSEDVAQQVLSNMRNFSQLGHFYSICVAAVVRQLSSKNLCEVHRIFCGLDKDGNGVLTIDEVQQGFSAIYPPGSPEMQDLQKVVGRLDKDGSGSIDYNEFCAAAVGERVFLEESSLWAAFRAFDQVQDGKLTLEEIKGIFRSSDVGCVWNTDVLDAAAEQALKRFDTTGDGAINFEEFSQLMREHAKSRREAEAEKLRMGWSDEERDAQISLDRIEEQIRHEKTQKNAYKIVEEMNQAHRDHFGRGLFHKVAKLCNSKVKPQTLEQARLGSS